jgi:hypothetical protein
MFCPECQAEYRSGFTHCADCEVGLIDSLPPTQAVELGEPSLLNSPQTIWIGDDEEDWRFQCKILREAHIPYEVTREVKDRRKGMEVIWRYKLAVSAEDEHPAKELLQLPEKVVGTHSRMKKKLKIRHF